MTATPATHETYRCLDCGAVGRIEREASASAGTALREALDRHVTGEGAMATDPDTDATQDPNVFVDHWTAALGLTGKQRRMMQDEVRAIVSAAKREASASAAPCVDAGCAFRGIRHYAHAEPISDLFGPLPGPYQVKMTTRLMPADDFDGQESAQPAAGSAEPRWPSPVATIERAIDGMEAITAYGNNDDTRDSLWRWVRVDQVLAALREGGEAREP